MTELKTGGITNPHPRWSDIDIKKDALAWKTNGPRKPLSSFDARIRYVKTDESLASIAAEVKRQLKVDFDGIKLAEFNWNTITPKKINWYLKHYSGCKEPTGSKYNYMFQTRSPIPEFIWVPKKKKPAGRKVPGGLTKPNTVTQPRCKYRTGDDCEPPISSPCRERPGAVPRQRVDVKNRRRNSVISSTQKVGQVTLTWTGERISDHQLQTAVKMGDRYTWIAQRLQFDWVTETVAEQEEIGTPGQQLPGNWQAERRRLDKLAQSNLSSVDDMKNVANAIRALVAEGRVKRLIIRGYADRVETKKQDPVALSQRRAEFVRDQLVKRYRIDFTGIDVFTIGCGTWYAPADEHKPSRAVEVEPELGDPPEEAAFEQIVPAWIFHTYHGPKPGNGEVGEIFELEYFKESGGNVYRDRVRSAAEVVLEQQRALSYIDAFEEISNEAAAVSGATGQGALLEQMRDAVRDWTWTPPGLPSLKSKRVKISEGKYKSVDSVPEALKIVQPDGSIKLTPLRPQLIRELKEVSHTVENLWSIPLSGHMDDQVQRRLHANIESPPNIDASGLTVGFKSSMPVPP